MAAYNNLFVGDKLIFSLHKTIRRKHIRHSSEACPTNGGYTSDKWRTIVRRIKIGTGDNKIIGLKN